MTRETCHVGKFTLNCGISQTVHLKTVQDIFGAVDLINEAEMQGNAVRAAYKTHHGYKANFLWSKLAMHT